MFDRSICLLVLALFVSNTIYGLASPFLPTVMEEKNISSVWTGVIFSAFAMASILSSLLIGKTLDKIGHNRVIMFGCLLMAGCIAAFGFIDDLEKAEYVIPISIALRVGQGKSSFATKMLLHQGAVYNV